MRAKPQGVARREGEPSGRVIIVTDTPAQMEKAHASPIFPRTNLHGPEWLNNTNLSDEDFTMASSRRGETTSKTVATKAAKLLANPKTSKAVKSVAGSALTQKVKKK